MIFSKNAGAKLRRLSKVVPVVTCVVAASTSSVIIGMGLGVVVATARGSSPKRNPKSSWSHASA